MKNEANLKVSVVVRRLQVIKKIQILVVAESVAK
jgi:hypothetical protein